MKSRIRNMNGKDGKMNGKKMNGNTAAAAGTKATNASGMVARGIGGFMTKAQAMAQAKVDDSGVKYLVDLLTKADNVGLYVDVVEAAKGADLDETEKEFIETLREAVRRLEGHPELDKLRVAIGSMPVKVGVKPMSEAEVRAFIGDDETAISEPIAPEPVAPEPKPEPVVQPKPAAQPAAQPKPAAQPAVQPKPAPVMTSAVAAPVDGPGYAFRYWDAELRLWLMKSDIWAAKQAGNGLYEPVWVWYKGGVHRPYPR